MRIYYNILFAVGEKEKDKFTYGEYYYATENRRQ